jgi:hypothetical protein
MKLKTKLINYKKETNNKLEKRVIKYILEYYKTDDEIKGFFDDLFYGGCASGFINDLIYYKDTLKFYIIYKDEINKLLNETISNFGSLKEAFGENYDETDPLNLETNNQNLFAWFGFEETANRLCYDVLGLEL